MKYFYILAAAFAAAVSARTHFGQCGGQDWTGSTTCPAGFVCTVRNQYYSRCIRAHESHELHVESYSEFTGTTTTTFCSLPSTGTSFPDDGTTMTTVASSTFLSTGTVPLSTGTSTPSTSPSGWNSSTGFKHAGINIAGFDFGCTPDGTCVQKSVFPPIMPIADGAGQMKHFVNDDGHNIFRLPVGWQFLVNQPGEPFNQTNFAQYDGLVQSCLETGASCILDIHNYARWNGGIVGQGGPTDDQLANVWMQLATKYATESKIIFGIMNEPHDLPSIATWAVTVQASVTAIRTAGASSQLILLPGDDFTGAGTFIQSGSLAALQGVTNPDGSTTNLIFDVHKYLDVDGSGSHDECVTNNIDKAFAPLATALRAANRQALLTETGGGNTASCEMYLCQQIQWLDQNADVFLGFVGWAAGSFSPPSPTVMSMTPVQVGNKWTDADIVTKCLMR